MVQPYNITNITGTGDFVALTGQVNSIVGQWFAIGWLIVLFIVIFLNLKNYFTKNALFPAAFVVTLNAIGFFLLGWISQRIMLMAIFVLAVSLVWLIME